MKAIATILLGAALLFPLFGCQTSQPTPAASSHSMQVNIDPKLRNQVSTGDFITGFTNGNLMTLDFDLIRTRAVPSSAMVEVKVEWLDRHGRNIPTPLSRFNRVTLTYGRPHAVQAIAPSEAAADFRVVVRPIS